MRIRCVTWNLHSCVGRDRRCDPWRVARVLAALEPDVVGLQEVDWRRGPETGQHQFEVIAEALGLTAIAGPNLRDHRGSYGNGLLTRFPAELVRRLPLSFGTREPRGAIDALLRHEDGSLRVVVTHLGLRRGERREQLAVLRDTLATEQPRHDATVLLGDLNEWVPPAVADHLLVPEPFPTLLTGRTYPSRFPLFALDRLLAHPEPRVHSWSVVRTPEARIASDHLPLVAELEWPGAAPASRARGDAEAREHRPDSGLERASGIPVPRALSSPPSGGENPPTRARTDRTSHGPSTRTRPP